MIDPDLNKVRWNEMSRSARSLACQHTRATLQEPLRCFIVERDLDMIRPLETSANVGAGLRSLRSSQEFLMSIDNATVFSRIEPSDLWTHFEAITKIARPSGEEEAMADYIREWANSLGLDLRSDDAGNLCIRVPATPGREHTPIVVLQGHLDMVVANAATALPNFDAAKGRIHLIRKSYEDGEYIEADLTTLGADNGIAIATMCAIAEDQNAVHGELELLMTVEEETGLFGASKLDPALLNGRIMLNLDSEDDRVIFIGCAGGTDLRIRWTRPRTAVSKEWIGLTLTLDKLRGGHSGAEIDKNRLNANKAMARLLQTASLEHNYQIDTIQGGDRRNAIARFASAAIWIAPEAETAFRTQLAAALTAITEQYRRLEPGIELSIEVISRSTSADITAFSIEDSAILINLIRSIPSGISTLSQDLPGLVETSNNIGIIGTNGESVEIVCSPRSSVRAAMDDMIETLTATARLAGANSEVLGSYPGWEVNLDSDVLKVAQKTYQRLFGTEPAIEAIHAGLEAGVIGARIEGGMDVISFGPNIKGAHAPGERVSIDSVGKFYQLLTALLDDLSAPK